MLAMSFSGVRCLVTGHTGFKGSWLCRWLSLDGAHVAGLSLAPEPGRPNLFEDLGLTGEMVSTIGDIRDFDTVKRCLNAFNPDIVFHLAAQPLVRRSYADTVGTFATNVQGTVHVLEAARQCPSVRAIVCVTSDKCYDNREWVWGYRETDPLGGADPYSASKGAAEIVAGSYARTIFPREGRIHLATARGGNVIGGGDWSEDRLVPDVVRAIAAKQPLVIRSPGAIRPWQHVLELVRGYVTLGSRLLSGDKVEGAWNFGPTREAEITVQQLLDKLLDTWKGNGLEISIEPSQLKESNFLKLDISKADAQLQWRPILGIDETLKLTVDWYRAYAADPTSALNCTNRQLAEYRRRV